MATLNWKEIVQDYIIKHSDKIKKTTRPLHERFKIEYFTYHKIDAQGKYTVLVDRPEFAEHYVNAKYFNTDPYLRHPDVYKSGSCFYGAHGSDEHKQKVMREGKELFNLDYGLLLIEKTFDAVEFFSFCGNSQNTDINRLHLNHPWIFKTFAAHFKQEFNSVLYQMEEQASPLITLKGSDFLCNEPIHPDFAPNSLIDFLKDLGKDTEIQKSLSLSPREKECLVLLLEGFTAKDTALRLKLSYRTVEFYLERIKIKLACPTKHELFLLAKQLKSLGLLSI